MIKAGIEDPKIMTFVDKLIDALGEGGLNKAIAGIEAMVKSITDNLPMIKLVAGFIIDKLTANIQSLFGEFILSIRLD